MKTPEQIAMRVADQYCPVRDHHDWHVTYNTVLEAIKEAIQQEKERTCEWVYNDKLLEMHKTQCGVSMVYHSGLPFCGSCGGKIVCKEDAK